MKAKETAMKGGRVNKIGCCIGTVSYVKKFETVAKTFFFRPPQSLFVGAPGLERAGGSVATWAVRYTPTGSLKVTPIKN